MGNGLEGPGYFGAADIMETATCRVPKPAANEIVGLLVPSSKQRRAVMLAWMQPHPAWASDDYHPDHLVALNPSLLFVVVVSYSFVFQLSSDLSLLQAADKPYVLMTQCHPKSSLQVKTRKRWVTERSINSSKDAR